MPLYLTLSRGPRADTATPILASSDHSVVQAAIAAIARLGDIRDCGAVARAHGDWRAVSGSDDSIDEVLP